MHEHLGGDAADVEAGAAERPVLDERHVQVLEPRVEERVARAGADDDQVVVPHGQRLILADVDGTVRTVRGSDLTTAALHGLLRLRVDVFVVEQRCAYAELDGRDLDPGTVHFVLGPAAAPLATCACSARRAGNGASGACAPRRPPGGAAGQAAAGGGVAGGRRRAVRARRPGAPHWAVRWIGFVPSGPGYDWDGVPHVPMRRPSGGTRPDESPQTERRTQQGRGHGDMSDDAGRATGAACPGTGARGRRPDGRSGDRPRHADPGDPGPEHRAGRAAVRSVRSAGHHHPGRAELQDGRPVGRPDPLRAGPAAPAGVHPAERRPGADLVLRARGCAAHRRRAAARGDRRHPARRDPGQPADHAAAAAARRGTRPER